MKIVFTSLFRRGMGGGAGRVAHELAENFAKKHQVVMVCPADETGLTLSDDGLLVFGIRSAGDDEFHMPALSARTVNEVFDFLDDFQPDVVHAHDPALVGLVGQIWARMNLVPFVHTAHVLPSKALDFGTSDVLNLRWLKSSFSESVTYRVLGDFYENCDAIIALNESAQESIREFGYEGLVYRIPNGRSLSHYQVGDFASSQSREKYLTFIGYLSERKNQLYLLKVLRKLPGNYHLRLIGRALDKDYKEKLDEYCQKHNLKNVEFIGQLEHDEIPPYLADTHVFPSASKMEVQSLVVIEALASGTPVVGLSNETIDELINEENGVRLAKDSKPSRFAAAVEQICGQPPEEYKQMCQNARERVSHLDWSIIVDQTANAYQEIKQIKPTVSSEENDMLKGMVQFFTTGELEDFLLDRLDEARGKPGGKSGLLKRFGIPRGLRSFIRVPSSTWLISGGTVLISVIGYFFMKGRGRKKEK